MATIRIMELGVGAVGGNVDAVPARTSVNALSLGVSTAETMTIPADSNFVIFSATADFYAKYDGTATVPADVTDGTASELNPTARILKTGDTISLISPAATVVTGTFYK